MAFIGWIISLSAFLGGLSLHQQPLPLADGWLIERGLYALALLALPPLWAKDTGVLSGLGVGRGQRVMLAIAGVLCLPIVLQPLI